MPTTSAPSSPHWLQFSAMWQSSAVQTPVKASGTNRSTVGRPRCSESVKLVPPGGANAVKSGASAPTLMGVIGVVTFGVG